MEILKSGLLLFIIAIMTVSCGKDNPPEPEPPGPVETVTLNLTGESESGKVTLSSDASVFSLTFTSSAKWTITVPGAASWCSVSVNEGGAGDALVQLKVTANDSYDERNASLTIKAGNVSKTFVVAQKQRDAILVSSSKVEIEEDGGTFDIVVRSNVDVKYSISGGSRWLEEIPAGRSLKESVYSFRAAENESGSSRVAEITFTGAGLTETVQVLQIGGSTLLLTESKKYVPASGGRFSAELRSNVEFTYKIVEGSAWLHEDASRAMSSHTIYFVADEYTDTEVERQAVVRFTSLDGKISSDMLVIQNYAGAIIIGEKEIESEWGESKVYIAYSANRPMGIRLPSWIKVDGEPLQSRAMVAYRQGVIIAENTSSAPRTGSIVIYDKENPEICDSVIVNQKAFDSGSTLLLTESKKYLPASGGRFSAELRSNVEFTYKIVKGAEWLHEDASRAMSLHTIYFVADEYSDTEVERQAIIRFTSLDGEKSSDMLVIQNYAGAIIMGEKEMDLDWRQSIVNITYSANRPMGMKLPSWIKADGDPVQSRAMVAYRQSVVIAENTSSVPRTGSIVIYDKENPEICDSVIVTQKAFNSDPSIMVTESKKYVPASGGRFSAELHSNVEFTYKIVEGAEWLHEEASRTMISHTIYFIADEYTDTEVERQGIIRFTSLDGKMSSDMLVIQNYAGAIIMGEKEIEVDCVKTKATVAYSANRPMGIRLPYWIKADGEPVQSRAMVEYRQNVEIDDNLSSESRTGFIVIYDKENPEICDSVTVTQKPVRYSVSTSLAVGDFEDARSHTFTIDVESPIAVSFNVSKPLEKIGDNTFRMPANYEKGCAGMASVGIEIGTNPVERIYVNYTQPKVDGIDMEFFNIQSEGGEISVDISNNTDIEYSCDSEWISLKNKNISEKGFSVDSWIFTVDKNTGDERKAYITFSAGNFWKGAVTVSQIGVLQPTIPVSVEISEEGSLETAVGDNAMKIQNIALSGGVNGKDAGLLREMATRGKLTVADFSDVTFHKDLINEYYHQAVWRPGKITEENMIGHWMFNGSRIEHVDFPKNLQHLGYKAFAGSRLREAELPEGLLSIEEACFKDCSNLTKVSLPGSLETIPKYCFELAKSLADVTLGEGIRVIDDYAFALNGFYTSEGSLYSLTLPSTIEEIGYKAFVNTKIKEIVLPASLDKLGKYAFYECRKLSRVEFRCALDTLPERVLDHCYNLSEIVFPPGLKVIGKYALADCGLPYLTIPEGVEVIEEGALKSVGTKGLVLPESLREIGARALGYQSMVSSFIIPAGVKKIGNRAFDGVCYFKELHLKCPQPPEHQGEIFFKDFKYEECTLFVPRGSAAAYAADSYWKKFKAIVEE